MNAMRPIGEFAYDLLGTFGREFEGYREPAQAGKDSEAIHQMRVSARRLRACLRAFAPVLPTPLLQLEVELRWIGNSLGQVRDVDVQIMRWPDLTDLFLDLRSARLERLRLDLDSNRYADFAGALRSQIELAAFADPVLSATPVAFVAPDIAGRAFRSVRRISSEVDESSAPETIHSLRKRAKRLRYTIDPFAKIYGKPGKRFVAGLKQLQDLLGAHQDAIVALSFCSELRGRGFDVQLDEYAGQTQDAATELRHKIPGAIADLAERWLPLKDRMTQERRGLWKTASQTPK